ncbi:alanine racemase [Thiomicrorhabdus sediminis]|uniref:Alanine racemase n=1 Tax=Thiomicrorhabdus sediminis TaxID=2580412 RepID=A0A4P9K573_9GAMM|nr:alanine racemase [Thiomicrorhabdus sediminis]QCU90119.1 alanine racemase [Thiomicrorhabdus sediminis]
MNYRPAKAYINLPALRHNLKVMQQAAAGSKILAVIKANGYGHGIIRVAHHLSGADAFGVASIDEAMLLRQKGFLHRILLLEGLFCKEEIALVTQNRFDLVIHADYQLDWLLDCHISGVTNIWVKVDTGMHRLGFAPNQVESVIKRLEASANEFNIHLMSHFASADEDNESGRKFSQQQLVEFDALANIDKYSKSFANSAGIINYPQSHFQWVRPGISLYGGVEFDNIDLRPVMQLESALIAIKQIAKGESVGYGNTWYAERESVIGVIAIGYGDGYPRHAKNGTPVLIKGHQVSLVGRVSMDMITVDLTDLINDGISIQIGDQAVLWGQGLNVDIVAQHSDTIGYELLCGVTQRVPMIEIQ